MTNIKQKTLQKMNLKHIKKHNLILAFKISLLVGTALALINHYDMFLNQTFEMDRIIKILITYLVPFGVSLYSSTNKNA